MVTDPRFVAFITAFREQHGNVSTYKIKPFLDAYVTSLGIATISVSTIGKIIKRKRLVVPSKKRLSKRRQAFIMRLRRAPKEKTPGYVEMDSICLYVASQRYYFMSVIDVVTKTAVARSVPSLSAVHAKRLLETYIQAYPVRTVQTDNGSEFLGVFDDYLQEKGIVHQWIYPRSPRINGVVERFNRTLQEECLYRMDELVYDHEASEKKLDAYLFWYNTKRPHHSLKLKTPVEYYHQLITFPEC